MGGLYPAPSRRRCASANSPVVNRGLHRSWRATASTEMSRRPSSHIDQSFRYCITVEKLHGVTRPPFPPPSRGSGLAYNQRSSLRHKSSTSPCGISASSSINSSASQCRVQAIALTLRYVSIQMVPKAGVEPARGCPQRFLRPPRLPFRHFGVRGVGAEEGFEPRPSPWQGDALPLSHFRSHTGGQTAPRAILSQLARGCPSPQPSPRRWLSSWEGGLGSPALRHGRTL